MTIYQRLSVAGGAGTAHRRSANLDVVRAVAAIMVVVSHAALFAIGANPTGWRLVAVGTFSAGIALFFALSGYLIAGPFLRTLLEGREAPSAGRYAVRRAARILPAWWIAATAVLVMSAATIEHWWQVPVNGLLLQELVVGEPNRLLFVDWTLSVEAMFYVFVPLAALLAWRATGRRTISVGALAAGVVGVWAASSAIRLGTTLILTPQQALSGHVSEARFLARTILPNSLGAFCPGILIYLAETAQATEAGGIWARYRRLRERPGAVAAAAVVLLVAAAWVSQRGGRWFDVGSIFHAVPAGLFLVAFMGEGRTRSALGRVLGPVGLVSYGVYLWHAVVRQTIVHHWMSSVPLLYRGAWVWPLDAALLLALTLPLALASWLLVERPLLRLTTRWDRTPGRVRHETVRLQAAPAASTVSSS
jgi:peptidoglycan/LPS O-acetylase OafA/YrhL